MALHIGSGQAGLYTIPGWTADFVQQAREHAENPRLLSRGTPPIHYWAQIDSLGEFVELLNDLRDPELGIGVSVHQVDNRVHVIRAPVEIAYMDFHSHGNSGYIELVGGVIDWADWRELRGNGFEQLFVQGAEIRFYGCSVASGPKGEHFLAECGSLFLRRGGGFVTGWPDIGLAVAGMDETAHIASMVTAVVRPGGALTLRNAEHLLPHRLRRRAQHYQREFTRLMRNPPRSPAMRQRYTEILRDINLILWHLDQQPSYDALYGLHLILQSYSAVIRTTVPPPVVSS
jgi:hypothetical protein